MSNCPSLDETNDMSLLQLVQRLACTNSIDTFFSQHQYSLKRLTNNVIGIKYIDGLNKIWRPKWSRLARGRFYYIYDSEKDEPKRVVELKSGLERGVELLTKAHTEAELVDNDEIMMYSHLSETQTKIVNLFQSSLQPQPIDAYLTSKVDGSLIVVSVYPPQCEQYALMKQLAASNVSLENQLINKYLIAQCNHETPLVIVSTQSTLFIENGMEDHFLASLSGVLKKSEWKEASVEFYQLILKLYGQAVEQKKNLDQKMACFFFEAICQNQTSLNGRLLSELACNYDQSGFLFLGMTIATSNYEDSLYKPHFDISQDVFEQPMYLRIKNTQEVFNLMQDLEDVVKGVSNEESFFRKFNQQSINNTRKIFHPEGFVLLTRLDEHVYDFAKIKTRLFYICHKFNEKKLNEIKAIPKHSQKYFSILKRFHAFHENKFEKIESIVSKFLEWLEQNLNPHSKFYQVENPKVKQKYDSFFSKEASAQNPEEKWILFKMMMNSRSCQTILNEYLKELCKNTYDLSNTTVTNALKRLIINMEPWRHIEWRAKLNDMINKDDQLLQDLKFR